MEAAEKHRGAGAALVVCLALPLGAAALGGAATASSVDTWYPELAKPAWTPPGWIFGPVWTVLYLMMGTASWLVWRERPRARALVDRALALYAAQLALNVLWSVVFFGLRRPGWAVAEIALLWLAILATLLAFRRVRPAAAWLLVPYLAWTTFAAALNGAIAWLARG
jgi:tryptophan-rich sensory protein